MLVSLAKPLTLTESFFLFQPQMLKIRRWKGCNTIHEWRKFLVGSILEANGLSKINNMKKCDNGKCYLSRY